MTICYNYIDTCKAKSTRSRNDQQCAVGFILRLSGAEKGLIKKIFDYLIWENVGKMKLFIPLSFYRSVPGVTLTGDAGARYKSGAAMSVGLCCISGYMEYGPCVSSSCRDP